jgi:hypothetical protein
MSFDKYDKHLIDLYQEIKWEKKWQSLEMQEKLELLAKLDNTLRRARAFIYLKI